MTPEGKVKEKIKAILKECGVYYTMPLGSGLGKKGVPDFLCCVAGQFLGIEAKAGKGKLTKLQEIEHEKIAAANGVCLVVREEDLDKLPHYLAHLVAVQNDTANLAVAMLERMGEICTK